MSTAAERRREVLERARDRRRRLAAERDQQPLRRAMFLGGAIGLAVGVVLGALFWDTVRVGPSIVTIVAVVVGTGVGAALGLAHARAERKKARVEARAREYERARRREGARRELRAREVVAARTLLAEPEDPRRKPPAQASHDDDFLVPPGFYPDPDGSGRRRWWDGVKWTANRAA